MATCRFSMENTSQDYELPHLLRLDANEHLRSKKIQELIDYCGKCSRVGETVNIIRATFRTAMNLLSNTFFSIDLTDPFTDSAKEFKELVSNISIEAGKPNVVDFFPFLQKIDPQGIRRRMTKYFTKILHLMSDLIDERLKERSMSKHANVDVLDALLSICPKEIDRNQIEQLCPDLFEAGTDTTSNTLEWAMAELLKNPHTLEKAQEELAQVIGRVPFLIPRKTEEDVDFCGYIIPKDSQVLVNVWAIGRDSSLWEDPLDFKLERICLGLPLAIRMIPIVLGSLLNTFNWNLQDGITPKDLDMEKRFGITLAKAQPLLAIPIPL
ncbi:hypothetical protein H5410_006612 [Solanum commersonii]|uniref:Geraniol 10-hydroxylase n=1 Tax=Solanum commersonii TaxID=4109 RepID=A0A9J6AB09_SOLCO|nr:hypothetical protein H5410_006612 [Solanum commersonii]